MRRRDETEPEFDEDGYLRPTSLRRPGLRRRFSGAHAAAARRSPAGGTGTSAPAATIAAVGADRRAADLVDVFRAPLILWGLTVAGVLILSAFVDLDERGYAAVRESAAFGIISFFLGYVSMGVAAACMGRTVTEEVLEGRKRWGHVLLILPTAIVAAMLTVLASLGGVPDRWRTWASTLAGGAVVGIVATLLVVRRRPSSAVPGPREAPPADATVAGDPVSAATPVRPATTRRGRWSTRVREWFADEPVDDDTTLIGGLIRPLPEPAAPD